MGEKIKELRESKGISQYRLAELTGINRSTINRYENGSIQKISFDNLLKNMWSFRGRHKRNNLIFFNKIVAFMQRKIYNISINNK